MAANRRGPRTTAEIAARERGILRRGDNHILRDENDVPIDGYRPMTTLQLSEIDDLLYADRRASWVPGSINNVQAADIIRRLERRAACR